LLPVEVECIEASLFNNKWIISKRSLEQFQFDENVVKDPNSMTFVDKQYEHNLFKDNTSAVRHHYNVKKWSNVSGVNNPENKVDYNERVKKFEMKNDDWMRKQGFKQKNIMNKNGVSKWVGEGESMKDGVNMTCESLENHS